MKLKYLLFLLLILPLTVNADCSTKELTRLRKLANNVTTDVRYETKTYEEEGETFEDSQFNIIFTNVIEDLYIYDEDYLNWFYPENGIATADDYASGKTFHFSVKSTKCGPQKLADIYVTVPFFNNYYNKDVCKGYSKLSVCQKWVKYYKSEEEIQTYIEKYNEEYSNQEEESKNVKGIFDYLIIYFKEYYYIIIPIGIVVLLIGIIIYKNYRKKTDLF